MSTKQKLQIVEVIERSGISQKTGRPYTMRNAQCVLHQETPDGIQCVVGTVFLPDSLKDYGRGEYLVEFAFSQSREGQLVPRIVSLQPYGPSPKVVAKSGAGVGATNSAAGG